MYTLSTPMLIAHEKELHLLIAGEENRYKRSMRERSCDRKKARTSGPMEKIK
jgi:hypothetical protein